MKKLFIILLFLLNISLAFSQKEKSDMFIQEDEFDTPVSTVQKKDVPQKVFTNIAIGSSVMSSGSNNYSLNTYINPTIGYQFSPKLSVSVGLMAVQSNLNNYSYYNSYEGTVKTINYSGLSSFVTLQANYKVSDKITVYGGVMVGSELMDFAGTDIPNNKTKTPSAYRLGVEYKIGEHTSLQFEFQYRDVSPMQNMQMQSGTGSGFGMMHNSSPFGANQGRW